MAKKRARPPQQRPRVICHMEASIDGRIDATNWPSHAELRREYEQTAATYAADAWMCGRITMEPFAGAVRADAEIEGEARMTATAGPRSDFIAPNAEASYAVAVDPRGRLLWQTNNVDGDHVVAVLGGRVSDEYLAYLRERGVSYLFAPEESGELDLTVAVEKLAGAFGVRTLLLEGGGRINGAMLRQGLIDEISLLVAPLADGRIESPALFDVDYNADDGDRIQALRLEAIEERADGLLWLRYKMKRGTS